jgi:hypothetical protein
MKPIKVLPLLVMFLLAGSFFFACKKIDLVRIAHVKTEAVSNINQTSATAHGVLVDLGEGGIKDYGFCWSLSSVNLLPTTNDAIASKGTTSVLGDYSFVITGLLSNSDYSIRSYARDDNGVQYGEALKFTTPTSGGTGYWLKYDDGINFTGIGLTDGSNFDYAIRFPVQALTNYDGYRISKIKFFPKVAADFYAEVFDGTNPPSLVFYEAIGNPVLNFWNEYTPSYDYYIDSGVELWVGIWVTNYVAGTYPAGCDDGTAIAGAGDMISFDSGASWESLYYGNAELNYNWNLEVFVTNQKGEEAKLSCIPENGNKPGHIKSGKGSASLVVSEKDVK